MGSVRFSATPPDGPSLAERAVQRSAAVLLAQREQEAAALMSAAMAVITRLGVERRASVAEIVAEAGLSNQAFYRHFATKDDLVAALVDAGARRLAAHLEGKMAGLEPEAAVRTWIRGVLSQATNPAVAAPTRAIALNRTAMDMEQQAQGHQADALVWALLEEPLAAMGVADPAGEAYLIGRLIFGVLVDALWADPAPKPKDLALVADFCLRRL